MVVHNYAWTGYPATFFAEQTPTIMVGQAQAEHFNRDPMNLNYMKHAVLADNLEAAMEFIEARDAERNYFWDTFIRKGHPSDKDKTIMEKPKSSQHR